MRVSCEEMLYYIKKRRGKTQEKKFIPNNSAAPGRGPKAKFFVSNLG
jgi:hypothetical protein